MNQWTQQLAGGLLVWTPTLRVPRHATTAARYGTALTNRRYDGLLRHRDNARSLTDTWFIRAWTTVGGVR